MRFRAVLGVLTLSALIALPGSIGVASAAAPPPEDLTCPANAHAGTPLAATPWPQQQLDFQAAGQVTQGRYVTSGAFRGQRFTAGDPVRVAVIDSGIDVYDKTNKNINPVFRGADIAPVHHVLDYRYQDCVGHGTEVSSLIVAQQGNSSYLAGVAPQVRLIPIQYTNTETNVPEANLEAALTFALSQHPRVVNLSLQSSNPPSRPVMALLERMRQQGIVVVAAGGNDGSNGCSPCYPAALSPSMPNIIAVSAIARNGQAADFGVTGHYVDVAAPGVDVPVASRVGGFLTQQGTSFATPFVTGTVALMLAAHPDMSPAQVKHRLEVTADPPPGNVPDTQFGYGTVNPLQAVTSVENDAASVPTPTQGPPLAAPHPAARAGRTLQHRALGIAVVLLGLAVLTVTGAAIVRGSRTAHARQG